MIWWIVGFKLFIDLSLFATITPLIKGIFILSGCIGLGGYLILIAHLLNKMQRSVSDKFRVLAFNNDFDSVYIHALLFHQVMYVF